jgi:hypothetical protein
MTQVWGKKNRDPVGHELPALGQPHVLVDLHQLGASIAAQNFVGMVGLNGHHAFLGFAEDGRHVGEVKLAVRVVGAQLLDVAEQFGHGKGVEAGVDLADYLLRRAGGFFFHDGADIVAFGALAQDASVPGGPLQHRGQQSHGGFLREVEITQLGDGFRRDLRRIAGQHDDGVISGQGLLRDHQGVSGAALLLLQDKVHAAIGHGCADEFRFVADDDVDVGGGHDLRGGGDHVRQQRLAARLVQHFGVFRFQARAFSRRHNGDGGARGGKRFFVVRSFGHLHSIYRDPTAVVALR